MQDARPKPLFCRSRIRASAETRPAAAARLPSLRISPERFINRELSWLHFNRRVLEEAANREPSAAGAAALPVDLGQQPRRILHGARRRPARARCAPASPTRVPDGLTPAEQLGAHRRGGRRCSRATSRRAGASCARNLAAAGIVLVDAHGRDEAGTRPGWRIISSRHIFPVLTPLAIDPAHPFPFIPNLGFTLALQLSRASDGKAMNALIRMPHKIDRFIRLPRRRATARVRLITLEQVDRPVHRPACSPATR